MSCFYLLHCLWAELLFVSRSLILIVLSAIVEKLDRLTCTRTAWHKGDLSQMTKIRATFNNWNKLSNRFRNYNCFFFPAANEAAEKETAQSKHCYNSIASFHHLMNMTLCLSQKQMPIVNTICRSQHNGNRFVNVTCEDRTHNAKSKIHANMHFLYARKLIWNLLNCHFSCEKERSLGRNGSEIMRFCAKF